MHIVERESNTLHLVFRSALDRTDEKAAGTAIPTASASKVFPDWRGLSKRSPSILPRANGLVNPSLLGLHSRQKGMAMQYALQVFETEDHLQFRTFDVNGEPWFSLADACSALDIKNASDAAGRLDEDEKGVVQTDTLGGTQKIRIINESGLWNLVMRSDARGQALQEMGDWNSPAPDPQDRLIRPTAHAALSAALQRKP